MTSKLGLSGVLAVLGAATLGVLLATVARGTPAAPAVPAAPAAPAAMAGDQPPDSDHRVWTRVRGNGSSGVGGVGGGGGVGGAAESLSLSATADRKGNSVVTARDLIVTPGKGRLVMTQTTFLRRDLTRVHLRDEQTGWWVQLETVTELDLGSFDDFEHQGLEDLNRQLTREREANPWRSYLLTGTGGLRFTTRARNDDVTGSPERALAMAQAILQNHLWDGYQVTLGEELTFMVRLWGRFEDIQPVPQVLELLMALYASLPKDPALEPLDRAYADASWEQRKSRRWGGIDGGMSKTAARAFIRRFPSVSSANPLVDAKR
ncbi:MAG TPA: hypothetical protein VKY89_12740 [Thermoanaerobaculia bacterium]|nr:hypothetical protein [Thermoanaerobaculia bacterium]